MCYSILVHQDLKRLELEFGAKPVSTQFNHLEKLTISDPKHFKAMSSHPRIYPNYFAPVIATRQNQNWIIPMRYRVRPMGSSEEIPTQYNVFNARLDSLQSRQTWSKLFGKQHGILVFNEFYEWVATKNQSSKKVIAIKPHNFDFMWAPVLWDWWESQDKKLSFFSFAVITGEPPDDILQAGHDRCPVFLKREHINTWLNPSGQSKNELVQLLHQTNQCDWDIQDAAK